MWSSKYKYMDQLAALEACHPVPVEAAPAVLSHIETPVNRPRWRAGLAEFRDQEFAQFILDGIEKGFRIGFQRGSVLRQVGHNMPCPDAKVVDEYLRQEMCLN